MENEKNPFKRWLGHFEHWQVIAVFLAIYDFIAVCASYFLALLLRFDGTYSAIEKQYIVAYNQFILPAAAISIIIFIFFRMYSGMWRFASFSELVRTILGSLTSSLLHTVLITVLLCRMCLSYYLIGAGLQIILLVGIRFSYDRGVTNGVEGLKILSSSEAREKEPALSSSVVAALWAPSAGIVCPFSLTIAMAENAADNGVEFRFLEEVQDISSHESGYTIITNSNRFEARCVINAAGVYADKFHNMLAEDKIHITPRRGEYVLMDKEVGDLVSATIFQLPSKLGKGVLVTPTAHGNLLVGPNAQDIDDKEDTETTQAGMDDIKKRALLSVPNVPYNKTITSFSGLRAHEDNGDFIIGEVVDGFFDAAGIESPGLTSAPAIGEYLSDLIAEKYGLQKKENFKATREGFTDVANLPIEERTKLINEHPEYGRIVCRCENISEGEIIDAIRRVPGAKSMDGIKRRVRQGMGRCQAGFCTPKAMEILARELNLPMDQVRKNRPGSELLKAE